MSTVDAVLEGAISMEVLFSERAPEVDVPPKVIVPVVALEPTE